MENKRKYSIKHLLIGLLLLLGVPIMLGTIFGESESGVSSVGNTEVDNEETGTVQLADAEKIRQFANSVYSIDNAMSKEWDDIHTNLKSDSPSFVDSQLQRGLDAMTAYKEQINNLVVPDLAENKTEKALKEVRGDLSIAYGHGSIYFAFLRRMISSSNMSDINAAQTGAESENQTMLEYKAKATAKLGSVFTF